MSHDPRVVMLLDNPSLKVFVFGDVDLAMKEEEVIFEGPFHASNWPSRRSPLEFACRDGNRLFKIGFVGASPNIVQDQHFFACDRETSKGVDVEDIGQE